MRHPALIEGIVREVRRVERAVEELAAIGRRPKWFDARVEDLPVLRGADAFAALTGEAGADAKLSDAVAQVEAVEIATAADSTRGTTWREWLTNRPAGGLPAPTGEAVSAIPELVPGAASGLLPRPAAASAPTLPPAARQHAGAANFTATAARGLSTAAESTRSRGLNVDGRSTGSTSIEERGVQAHDANAPAPREVAPITSERLLKTVERVERVRRSKPAAPLTTRFGDAPDVPSREAREFVPPRRLRPEEAEKLRNLAGATSPAASRPRHWPTPTGSGLRRLASIAEPLPEAASELAPAPLSNEPRHDWPVRRSDESAGAIDLTARLSEILRAEAVRSGIDPEDLIR